MDRVKTLVKYDCIDTTGASCNQGLTGKGINIAIFDTGIVEHIDLKGRVHTFLDCVGGRMTPYDESGHGTHVAGIISGSGVASSGTISGIAPSSNLHAIKVLDYKGDGNIRDTLKGIDWLMKNYKERDIRIVNISVGTPPTIRNIEEIQLLHAVEELWDAGLIVVTAAGNNGPESGSITLPGVSERVITVGACDDQIYINKKGDAKYNYSGRGPTFESVCKPDILAPGSYIKSCSNYRGNYNNRNKNRKYFYAIKSGTSMATPVVTGAIALLLEKYPDLTNIEVKQRLRESADDLNRPINEQGWGLLNIQKLLI